MEQRSFITLELFPWGQLKALCQPFSIEKKSERMSLSSILLDYNSPPFFYTKNYLLPRSVTAFFKSHFTKQPPYGFHAGNPYRIVNAYARICYCEYRMRWFIVALTIDRISEFRDWTIFAACIAHCIAGCVINQRKFYGSSYIHRNRDLHGS